MEKKILIYPESLPCGGIDFEIKVNDQSLMGKKATFSIQREVFVKDSRPVHENKNLHKVNFKISTTSKFHLNASVMRRALGSFPYSGSKIKIQAFAEVKVTTALFFKEKARFSLSNHVPSELPKRARVKNNTMALIEPKDTFNIFKNIIAIPAKNQIATLLILSIGTAITLFNLFVGYHDEMAPQHLTWFYSHYGSDGDKKSPLLNSFMLSGGIVSLIWFAMKKQLKKYMGFHFRSSLRKINRNSTINIGKLVTGCSQVDLIDPVLRVVACNMEKGKYIRGHGSNQRTISFSHPNRAVLLYSKRIPIIQKGVKIHNYLNQEFSFKPMFQALYPRQMISDSHGLDLVWEIQLLVDDFIDQELIGKQGIFTHKDFYTA